MSSRWPLVVAARLSERRWQTAIRMKHGLVLTSYSASDDSRDALLHNDGDACD